MRISDWSSDVCSSDLGIEELVGDEQQRRLGDLSDVVEPVGGEVVAERRALALAQRRADLHHQDLKGVVEARHLARSAQGVDHQGAASGTELDELAGRRAAEAQPGVGAPRSEEHTSEPTSLMRIPYPAC